MKPSAAAMRAAERIRAIANSSLDFHLGTHVEYAIDAEFAPVVEALRDALRDAIAILDRRRRGFDPGVSVGDLTKQVVDRGDKALAALKADADPFEPSLEDAQVAAILDAEFAPVERLEMLEKEIASAPVAIHHRRKWVEIQVDYSVWTECCRKHTPQFLPQVRK